MPRPKLGCRFRHKVDGTVLRVRLVHVDRQSWQGRLTRSSDFLGIRMPRGAAVVLERAVWDPVDLMLDLLPGVGRPKDGT